MALLQRKVILGSFNLPVGVTAIAANSICKIASSLMVVGTASSEATAIYVPAEDGALAASKEAAFATPGSIVFVNAHDGDIAEGEWLVCAAAGRADGAAALTGGTQYYVGQALQASSAQDQKIAMLYLPGIAPDAAS